MKYVIFLGDGMSDEPLPELDGRTPLMVADTPNLDRMVREGVGGWSKNTPDGFEPGSDVANLGVLGYDVRKGYTGRSPLEAAAMGVELAEDDVAFRCNLVTLADGYSVMGNFSSGHIPSSESHPLIEELNRQLGDSRFQFYPGVSYRHLLVWKSGRTGVRCTPPHDISERPVADHLPAGEDSAPVMALMRASHAVLAEHPVNRRRRADGLPEANAIWLWGHGRRPVLPPFRRLYGKTGGMISAVDLMRGIANHIGFEYLPVPGATGWIDTDYAGKASACLAGLERQDLVFVHVESPDESGHAGRLDYKIQAITDFDRKVVGPVLDGLARRGGPFRALALPDHPTPVAKRTHTPDRVPFALYGAGIKPDVNVSYDERLLERGSLGFDPGCEMMAALLAS
ncbi:MAG: cofactor-independent phosphoglycerate mutase [Magnetococcales bacterium]|nr:cofactor-independent phosphoglycerate mutase [Magnetococcales bacterium]MBF0155599.1 cofactor-independent phosphoglycerate mutase [Magnetococcales bacterium]